MIVKEYNGQKIRTENDNLNLHDVAFELGYTRKAKGTSYLRKERIVKILETVGVTELSTVDNFEEVYITESQFYDLCFESKAKHAKEFRKWVTDTLLPLVREKTGLEAFECWRMLDKEHQKKAMSVIQENKQDVKTFDYIIANSSVNKITCDILEIPYSKKKDMSPEQLIKRQQILTEYEKLFEVFKENSVVNKLLRELHIKQAS